MVSLFEVETLEVNEDKKERVLQEVVNQQGPPDGTVIVSLSAGGEFEDETVNTVMERFTEIGEVVIIRLVCIHHCCKNANSLALSIKPLASDLWNAE